MATTTINCLYWYAVPYSHCTLFLGYGYGYQYLSRFPTKCSLCFDTTRVDVRHCQTTRVTEWEAVQAVDESPTTFVFATV